MPIYSKIIDTPVLSIALEYMGMVLDCFCLSSEAQLSQKSGKSAHHEVL